MCGRYLLPLTCLLLGAASPPASANEPGLDARTQWTETCKDWDEWDKAGPPFRLWGNPWYVGTCGISAILVTGSQGHVLIDGGPSNAGALVANNIEALGFKLADVKLLLHSHEHHDHVGGLAELQRRSGARLLASPEAAPVLENGVPAAADPQYGTHDPFPAARVDGIVADGETVRLGDLALTPVATPGHTPGALTWQWQSCEAGRCRTIVYADSLSAVSGDAYRFSDHPAYVAGFRAGIDRVGKIDCDMLLTPHPSASGMREKLIEGDLSAPPRCGEYAAGLEVRLDERLFEEAGPE